MLKIQETVTPEGQLSPVFLRLQDGSLCIVSADGRVALPDRALGAVMVRYGVAFDATEPVAPVAALELGGGRSLRHVRHLAGYDVIARDYLVYEVPGETPLCALSATVARALLHLARVKSRAAARPDGEG
jgi:hypothetical protein